MKLSTGISTFVKLNWILVIGTILLVCCSCINSKPTDAEQITEHDFLDSLYPTFIYTDGLVGQAGPRIGRASPRLGRASPRLGRRTPPYILSGLNHAGRYYIGDDDGITDYHPETDSSINEKRAAPRLGRTV